MLCPIAQESERIFIMEYINDGWICFDDNYENFLKYKESEALEKGIPVRIPHSVSTTPFNYFDEQVYQKTVVYKRIYMVDKALKAQLDAGKKMLLTVEGAAHYSRLYVNENFICDHGCGYTAFTADITDKLREGENTIVIEVCSSEKLNIPPFGHVIDYMTYGGIYRDIYLELKNEVYLSDVYIFPTPQENLSDIKGDASAKQNGGPLWDINYEISISNDNKLSLENYIIRLGIKKNAGYENGDAEDGNPENAVTENVGTENAGAGYEMISQFEARQFTEGSETFKDPHLWSVDDPQLYDIKVELISKKTSEVVDVFEMKTGFREAEFKKDGFYLNGEKLKIRGLNRHQSFPYTGYAMPESMQRNDARILKYELGLNAVRTSHYPQSHYFIDECDRQGLLVFTEIPGWQHIGDEEWKLQAIRNVKDMVRQYRNHTSIILWGVRINESPDDDDFYIRTNEAAHQLDKRRPTGGVRCIKNSNLLEDVYTYNDFVHNGEQPGCEPKSKVTSDMNKPYLVSEYNGHMFPTKNYDSEEHRTEHMLRHARVLNEISSPQNSDICGSFGWCAFDYNTHKDFGSGDRICYHGVMDMFRNPKTAAYIYAAQGNSPVRSCAEMSGNAELEKTVSDVSSELEKTVFDGGSEPDNTIPDNTVLHISSSMDIGEHPASVRGKIYIISDADSVKMYKNGRFIKEYTHDMSEFKNLKKPPILIDDYIGDALTSIENMPTGKAERLKYLLNRTALVGMAKLDKKAYRKAAYLMLRYGMKMDDAGEMYNRYIGDWGGKYTSFVFEAIKNGRCVKKAVLEPVRKPRIEAIPDHTQLIEKTSYDVALVRIRAVDENGNVLSYMNAPVSLETEGDIELIGPGLINFNGGMTGTFVKSLKVGSQSETEKNILKFGVQEKREKNVFKTGKLKISSPGLDEVVVEFQECRWNS